MPHKQKHRGARSKDAEIFHPKYWPAMQEAVDHLSWLLTRNYSDKSALKLVGDHFQLNERQRKAVMRASCSDQSLEYRTHRKLETEEINDHVIHIDGFNLIITIESALSNGFLFEGRDGSFRDLASVHSTYKKVEETIPALELCAKAFDHLKVKEAVWYLDAPVSNSKRLAGLIRKIGEHHQQQWDVLIKTNPDKELIKEDFIIISSDSFILDHCHRWFNGARFIIENYVKEFRLVPMTSQGNTTDR